MTNQEAIERVKQVIWNDLSSIPEKDALATIYGWLFSNGLIKQTIEYKQGHRDARHKAAELVSTYPASFDAQDEVHNDIMNLRIEQ